MIDKERLKTILVKYKEEFASTWWKDEKYKWEAVKTFQDNWDINTDSGTFSQMLKKSLSKTNNLLASNNFFPCGIIEKLADVAPEEVRELFKALFDESRNVVERILEFKDKAKKLKEKYIPDARQHYQTENAVSTYLWLRFPDKYYIYKFGIVKLNISVLHSDYEIRTGTNKDKLTCFYSMYDEICEYISADQELTDIFKSQLSSDCYPDPEYRTLTIDIGYYISSRYSKNVWKISHGSSVLHNYLNTFRERKVVVVDGQTKAKALSRVTQGDDFVKNIKKGDFFYLCYGNSIQLLGKFTSNEASPNPEIGGNWQERGYEVIAESKNNAPYTNTKKWWTPNENSTCIKIGDENDLCEELILKPYFGMTIDELLLNIAPSVLPVPPDTTTSKKYTKEDFLSEVFMSEAEYDKVVAVLKNKKNLILQGAPGVGKTFAAKRLAYSIMGECNDSRIEFVQFHQSYSYEDFMLGYKPSESGFELRQGIFYTFCLKAANEPEKDFFFIIDEINRGNMSKIFGELLMLIEKDYRGKKTTLAYDGRQFSVPVNLHIIGMMNTADRSLAMIDYALRRRFSFYEMAPAFDSDSFRQYKEHLGNERFNLLIEKVKELNHAITNDNALGKGFRIGHSYFCNWEKDECTVEKMRQVLDFDILPMLEEFWFDDASKVERWQSALRAILE
ncbi:MAG: AAA family ATPase [Prevotellaceae bacterium]|nr:AAA family ATPase [Prevotellaceae bacterium]